MCGPINWLGGHWHISTMRTFVSYPLCLFFIHALFHFFHNFPFPACLLLPEWLPNRFCVLVQTMNDVFWTTNFSFITQHSYLVGKGIVCVLAGSRLDWHAETAGQFPRRDIGWRILFIMRTLIMFSGMCAFSLKKIWINGCTIRKVSVGELICFSINLCRRGKSLIYESTCVKNRLNWL